MRSAQMIAGILGLVVAVLWTSDVAQAAVVDGLVLHATMNSSDISGTALGSTVSDTAGSAENGTLTGDGVQGSFSNPSGQMGKAISLSTGNLGEYIDFGDVHAPGTGSFTVSLWYKMGAATFDPITLAGTKLTSGSAIEGWEMIVRNDENDITKQYLRVIGCDPTGTVSPYPGRFSSMLYLDGDNAIDHTKWHHLVMVIDRTANKIIGYLDGSNANWVAGGGGPTVDTIPTPPNFIDNTGNMIVLKANWPYTDRLIDDYAVWNRALTADEISAIYTYGLKGLDVTEIPASGTFLTIR